MNRLERFLDPDHRRGTLASVSWRLEVASTLSDRSVDAPEVSKRWDEARADIATLDGYEGLDLPPQIGLVPLHRDPHSELWEFWHVLSGDEPRPNPDPEAMHSWILDDGTGMILVLLPGGTFRMGDDHAHADEGPAHDVTLGPFFLSKYEVTQGQWLRATGENPSLYAAGGTLGGRATTLQNPVERVSWDDCHEVLGHLGLSLPTEAQWEYAARAGTREYWWMGNTLLDLLGKANFSDPSWLEASRDGREIKCSPGIVRSALGH